MNTKSIKEIGKWMMVTGGTIFTSGAGFYFVGNYIERREETRAHKAKMDQMEEESRVRTLKLKEEQIKAETEKNKAYTEQLKNMDQKMFAKVHADKVAMADEKVRKEAERVKKEAEATVTKTRLECNEAINKIREECLRKIEAADKKRDEAIEKYETIDTLFTNKNEILKAKEALEAIAQKDKETKDDKEALLEDIKALLE